MDGDTGKFWTVRYWSPADWVSNVRAFVAPILAVICVLNGLGRLGETFWDWWWLTWLIVGVTDKLDGSLAKWLGSCQRGATNDEQSDKVCLFSVFIACIILDVAPWYLLVVMMLRDVLVTYARMQMRKHGDDSMNGAGWIGKAKTVFQFIMVSVAMMPSFMLGRAIQPIAVWLLAAVATVLSLVSGWGYIKAAMSKLRGK